MQLAGRILEPGMALEQQIRARRLHQSHPAFPQNLPALRHEMMQGPAQAHGGAPFLAQPPVLDVPPAWRIA